MLFIGAGAGAGTDTDNKKTDRLRNTEHAFIVMINYNILFYYQR